MIESCSVYHELFVPIFGQGGYPQHQGHCQHLVEQFPESCNKRKPILVREETENMLPSELNNIKNEYVLCVPLYPCRIATFGL